VEYHAGFIRDADINRLCSCSKRRDNPQYNIDVEEMSISNLHQVDKNRGKSNI
jgi:hypothetical protein